MARFVLFFLVFLMLVEVGFSIRGALYRGSRSGLEENDGPIELFFVNPMHQMKLKEFRESPRFLNSEDLPEERGKCECRSNSDFEEKEFVKFEDDPDVQEEIDNQLEGDLERNGLMKSSRIPERQDAIKQHLKTVSEEALRFLENVLNNRRMV
ncbi:hypothetical protein FO519_008345 [Halicephalobus sp. NKZ332]|nr:hypothetical protein FO519_008345 [Halicephalobus sp. NKZ332]